MNHLFWNKIFAAVLATALVMFGIRELGHALIHPHEPTQPGYKIAIAEEPVEEVEVVEEISLAQMLSQASATSGERVAKKCAACHSFTQGGANKIGPNLWGIVGRQSASHEGFRYSAGMKDFGETWNYENLNAFLTKPKAAVPGTIMGFSGFKKPEDTANVLVYLRTLSDAPIALPGLAENVTEEITEAETEAKETVVETENANHE